MSQAFVQVQFNPAGNPPLRGEYTPPTVGTPAPYVPPPGGAPVYVPPTSTTEFFVCLARDGTDFQSRRSVRVPSDNAHSVGYLVGAHPSGTYTFRAYSASTGGAPLYESGPITVAAAGAPPETGALSGVPTTGTVGSVLAGGTFSLTNAPSSGTTAFVGLWNATTGAYQGALQALTGTSGTLPSLIPAAAGTYAVKLASDSAGAGVLASSGNIAVAAASGGTQASDGTLTGLPVTIVAGQPLSAVTFSTSSASAAGRFVLWRVATGAEEGQRWSNTVLPGGSLSLLVPQISGAYTVRVYSYSGTSLLYESAQFTASAAPGALPSPPTQTADTDAVSGGVTTNWTATAPSYHVLARNNVGAVYGTWADVTGSAASFVFTGLPANSSARSVVIPQNSNGFGTASAQFISLPGA